MTFAKWATIAVLMSGTAVTGATNEFENQLKKLVETQLMAVVQAPDVLNALRMQNQQNDTLTQEAVDAMDQAWRAQVGAASSPQIDAVLATPISAYLQAAKGSFSGLVTEVFIMDSKGLNAAQSDMTSDLWQGDEEKWLLTYGMADGTIHISEVELDESTQTYQSQVSFPINDPDTGEALGAVTFGIDVQYLN